MSRRRRNWVSFTNWLKKPRSILVVLITILLSVSTLYLLLHWFDAGYHRGKFSPLSQTQLDVIKGIYADSIGRQNQLNELAVQAKGDSVKYDSLTTSLLTKDSLRLSYLNFYLSRIDIIDTITSENEAYFFIEAQKRHYLSRSFFWLKDSFLYWELIFFSLFGVLCNCLYHLSEHMRNDTYDRREAIVYYAKLFYAPFVTIILFLGFDMLDSEKYTEHVTPVNAIVLPFLIGFFAGRSIELLDRIKNVLLPTALPGSRPASAEVSIGEKNFKALSLEDQEQIINSFIESNVDHLKDLYPEIQGMSAGRKNIKGVANELMSVRFELETKDPGISGSQKIPSKFDYELDGKKYEIPTDIEGVGENVFHGTEEEFVQPKQLGMGCSRRASAGKTPEFGSIGLKVQKGGRQFLLSCYHVLCNPELHKNIFEFSSNSENEIISPSEKHRTQDAQVIAHVQEGRIDRYIDAAIAELTEEGKSLFNKYYFENGIPAGTRTVTEDDARKQITVKLVGRSSDTSYGKVTHHNKKITFFSDYPHAIDRMYDLIETTSISKGGDSGATVVDAQNNVIGMLVGGNSKRSHIIPIHTIFDIMRLTLHNENPTL